MPNNYILRKIAPSLWARLVAAAAVQQVPVKTVIVRALHCYVDVEPFSDDDLLVLRRIVEQHAAMDSEAAALKYKLLDHINKRLARALDV